MKATKLVVALLAATGLSAIAAPAMAYEAGDWLVRGRIAHINPNDDSGTLSLNGGALDVGEGVKVDSDTIPELDITYMITKNWGVELILGYSEHTVTTHKAAEAALSLGDVIDTKVLPPTLTLQYHFMPDSNIRPYAGLGVNYTYFFSEDLDGVLDTLGGKVKLEDSWGLAAQVGVDVAINDDWFFNADVKYIDIDTKAKFSNIVNGATSAEISADIDPFVYSIGIGRRF
jgi:outer membrane protein